jgi:hypothetical protein
MDHRHRVFGFEIIELDPQPSKPVTAPSPSESQAHRGFRDSRILIAHQARNRGVWSTVHPGGQLLLVRSAEQKRYQAMAFQKAGIAERAIRPVPRGIGLRGHDCR